MILSALLTAFGLSGAAGLNAYLPLFLVGVLSRAGAVKLAAPYDALGSTPMLALLLVLLVVEIVVDKIPGVDHVNDMVQTFIRPVAGAVLFASATGVVKGFDPRIALGMGLVAALGVHGVKAGVRPVVNVTTLGIGAPVVSLLEDLFSLVVTVVAIFAPLLVVVFFAGVAYFAWRLVKRWRSPRAARPGTYIRAARRGKAAKEGTAEV